MVSGSSVRPKSSRKKRGYKYHKLAFRNKLGSIVEQDNSEEPSEHSECTATITRGRKSERQRLVHEAKMSIVCELARSGGDSSSKSIQRSLQSLAVNYRSSFDPRDSPPKPEPSTLFASFGPGAARLEGTWMSLSKPNFAGCLGQNADGDYRYTLGRMAFDMFQPTQLVCSIQGTFNSIEVVDGADPNAFKSLPANLKADARYGKVPVRTYNIITAFTIEAGQQGDIGPNAAVDEPIEGIMTTEGYCLPYPTGNRLSVWFTGGAIEVSEDTDRWHKVFAKDSLPGRTFKEKSKLFAAQLLMGAETNDEIDAEGRISYMLSRPMASNIDLLYIDEGIRIMRGSSGAVYVTGRVQNVEDVSSDEDEENDRSRINARRPQRGNMGQPRQPMRRGSFSGASDGNAGAPSPPARWKSGGRSEPNELPTRRRSGSQRQGSFSTAPPQRPVRRSSIDSPPSVRSTTPAFTAVAAPVVELCSQ